MRHLTMLLAALTLVMPLAIVPAATANAASLDEVLAGPQRAPSNAARDVYRHPKETLEFFGVTPTSDVVEIWPGGGWYTEILGPYLREQGVYHAAGVSTTSKDAPPNQLKAQTYLADKLAGNPLYDHVVLTELGIPGRTVIAPPGRADFVLTFRNVHNWLGGGYAPEMFAVFFQTLKPGGVLGVEEHRAKPGTSVDVMKKTGYMTEEYVIDLATKAGFTLEASSPINANPKDTADYPEGVWTLPPNLRVCQPMPEGAEKDACTAKYRAIGESDRMTLKFRKPS